MKSKGKRSNKILKIPYVGRISHPIPGGRSLDITVDRSSRIIDILHKEKGDNGGTTIRVNIKGDEKVKIAFINPAVCGQAIRCLFTTGASIILDTITGYKWSGGKLQFVL